MPNTRRRLHRWSGFHDGQDGDKAANVGQEIFGDGKILMSHLVARYPRPSILGSLQNKKNLNGMGTSGRSRSLQVILLSRIKVSYLLTSAHSGLWAGYTTQVARLAISLQRQPPLSNVVKYFFAGY
jgi:hypothetical protein